MPDQYIVKDPASSNGSRARADPIIKTDKEAADEVQARVRLGRMVAIGASVD